MKNTTGIRDALIAFGLCLMAAFLIPGIFAGTSPWVGNLAMQLTILAVPFLFRYSPNLEDRGLLGRASGKDITLSLLLALFLAPFLALLGSLSGPLFPGYEEMVLRLTRLLQPGGLGLPEPLVFLLMALLPALAEELLFRGFILGRLRRSLSGTWPAILVSALLFSLIHLDPYRALPLFVLGAVLALLTLTTGRLWPAVACHLVNNLLALLSLRLLPVDPAKGLPVSPTPLAVILILIPTFLAGAILLQLLRRDRTPEDVAKDPGRPF